MSLPEGTVLKIVGSMLLPDDVVGQLIFWAVLQDFAGSGPLDEADILEAAANWVDTLMGDVDNLMASSVSGTLAEVWEVDGPTGDLTPIGDEACTWAGLSGSDPLPNGVAAIVHLKTTNTDVTGRKFIPGIAEGNATDNNWAAAALTALGTFGASWGTVYTDPNDVQFVPGVYSVTKNVFYNATGTSIVNAIAGYQRRRKPGVGI